MTRLRDTLLGLELYLIRDRETGAYGLGEDPPNIYGGTEDVGKELAVYADRHPQLAAVILIAAQWLRYIRGEVDEAERDYEIEYIMAEFLDE